MKRLKVRFDNKNKESLSGILELPANQQPHNYVLCAHCFTCSKNLTAIGNISNALTQAGFGVLRFDFTGLGESEGDFADTDFSGNVDDLLEAAGFLEREYQAPTVLIGHSLGGTASIFAADKLPAVKAAVVIGSPADPEHVTHLLRSAEAEIIEKGKAVVNIGGRDFTIKKQFLDDLKNKPVSDIVRNWGKSLLIFHSPQDKIVGIQNAEKIFKAAFHSKSFISLDGADHLMSNKKDSYYVGQVTSSWALRYVSLPEEKVIDSRHEVAASLDAQDNFTTHLSSGNHRLIADEPENFGGNDFGPTPYDLVSAGLAACSAMTMQMYARHKKWPLDNVEVHVSHSKEHAIDCERCENADSKIDSFMKVISINGNLTDEQRSRLLEIADRCPVHRTLTGRVQIDSGEMK